ncbi:hypothetical protein [Luteimonas sp. MHLX1A]|uniref:hypothetical protein n=1 Tax=Alterluteimonas muca TaxID=2878684 RepID=UPI001E56B3A4|nr:hypothetical protein [Luteimonas sp. MHLX1A]MCD9046784.1 hypothetical protein [Luteimonas sp. MHLX1A]
MRSDTNQLDLYRDDPRRIAQAWRTAAETALRNPFHTEAERRARHAYYSEQATRLEGPAPGAPHSGSIHCGHR